MKLTSAAFADGAPIPSRYTCDGDDESPPLAWSGAPPSTVSFALICDDPDAPGRTFVHWVVPHIPGTAQSIAAGAALASGMTDFRRTGYGGPCPPRGKPHRYYFKLYALNAALALPPPVTKADVERAMAGTVVDQAQLMGTYQRQ